MSIFEIVDERTGRTLFYEVLMPAWLARSLDRPQVVGSALTREGAEAIAEDWWHENYTDAEHARALDRIAVAVENVDASENA